MVDQNRTGEKSPIRSRTVDELGRQIASPDIHSGGGSAASASASLAAATAELVVRLTSNRKKTNADHGAMIAADLTRLQNLRVELLEAGDHDEAVLDRLMRAYATKGTSRTESLIEAARSTLAIAELAGEVIEIAGRQITLASRFTASDLGAAAVLANGAVDAALITVRINIELLAKDDPEVQRVRTSLRERVEALERKCARLAEDAMKATRERIGPQR